MRKVVREPISITTGTNILKLDPGFYNYQDANASVQDKLNMGLPASIWHAFIIVLGHWNDAEKNAGYINIIVIDAGTENPPYFRSFGWTAWKDWKRFSLTGV